MQDWKYYYFTKHLKYVAGSSFPLSLTRVIPFLQLAIHPLSHPSSMSSPLPALKRPAQFISKYVPLTLVLLMSSV